MDSNVFEGIVKPGSAIFEPSEDFLENIEGYLHNRFLNIGNLYALHIFVNNYQRTVPPLSLAIQRVPAVVERDDVISR